MLSWIISDVPCPRGRSALSSAAGSLVTSGVSATPGNKAPSTESSGWPGSPNARPTASSAANWVTPNREPARRHVSREAIPHHELLRKNLQEFLVGGQARQVL
jgi:hypothetical protein